jgi:GTPase
MSKAGIVTVAGKPNVGKSTLLNRLVGEKLAITSSKPQSTRDRVVGILSRDDTQIILFDTPGLLEPRYALHHAMRATAMRAMEDADLIAYIVEAADVSIPLEQAARLDRSPRAPVLTVINKADLLDSAERERLPTIAPEAVLVSAHTGEGIDTLLARFTTGMPEGPFLYPADDLSTQSLRFFVSELIRETALEQLEQEVPYSLACQVEEFHEERRPVYIRAVLYVERESQKRILIGDKGAQIRDLGRAARAKIETLVGASVYLDLWVKVLRNWRRDEAALRRLGYSASQETSS